MSPVVGSLLRGRLLAARGRQAAVVLALAVGVLIPLLIEASTQITSDAVLGRALARLPVGQRTAIVSFNGLLDRDELTAMDTIAQERLPDLVQGPIRRQLVHRALADGSGTDFVFAATDGLAQAVRLVEGRMPAECTPQRCEVVEIQAGTGEFAGVTPRVSGLDLEVVGTVERTDPLLLSGTFDVGTQTPLLLADGVQSAAEVEAFSVIGRSYGWVGELDRAVISDRGAEGWGKVADSVADALVRGRPGTALTVPAHEVAAELDRADGSARRFSLLAGGCGLLLLGAALIGAAALRPDTLRFAEALRRRGLGPFRIRLVVLTEALVLVLVAAGLGLAVGSLLCWVMLSQAGLPALSGAGAALGAALPVVIGLMAAAFGLMALVLRPVPDHGAAWRTVTWAAAGCLMALVLIISRGTADQGDDPLLVALPALLLLTAALLAARTWPWLVQAGDRVLPRRAVGARLAVAGIAGRPLVAASCLALLVAAIGATGFAASYRATLDRGADDQAAFAVPTDVRITSGTRPVLSVASLADYGSTAVPVLRQAGSVRVGTGQTDAIQLIGTDPAALGQVRRWSAVVGGSSPEAVAGRIAAPAAASPELPEGKKLTIGLTKELPEVTVSAWLHAPDGRERAVPLGVEGLSLVGAMPEGRGWALAALAVSQDEGAATRRQHRLGESDATAETPSGRIDLGAVTVDDETVEAPWDPVWDYRLEQSTDELWATPVPPGAPGSSAPLKVAADPLTAAQSPTLTLTVAGQTVTAQVVATLPRFPTVSGRFVLADVDALGPVLSRVSPGSGQPNEVWLSETGFTVPAGVEVQRAADIALDLRTDPVAEGAQQVLFLAALATLIVALAGVVLLVVGERAEDAAEFSTWEANGLRPGLLRQALWGRAVLVVVVAVPAGVLAGLALTVMTARLVRLTAGAQVPQPPLVPVLGATTTIPLLLAAFVITLLAAGLVALSSFRESS